MTAELADRLAGLADRHKSPGRVRREQLAAGEPCATRDCGRLPARLLPCGWRCDRCAPAIPDPASSLPPAPTPRPARRYGRATSDPLGRDGDGWRKSDQTRLPVRSSS